MIILNKMICYFKGKHSYQINYIKDAYKNEYIGISKDKLYKRYKCYFRCARCGYIETRIIAKCTPKFWEPFKHADKVINKYKNK